MGETKRDVDSATVQPQPNPVGSSGTRDKDGLRELPHLEAKRLGFYTPELVVGCNHARGRGIPPRYFCMEQLLWTESESSGKGPAASIGHQHSQQLSDKRTSLGKGSEQHNKSSYPTPKNKDDRKCLLLGGLCKPLFKNLSPPTSSTSLSGPVAHSLTD